MWEATHKRRGEVCESLSFLNNKQKNKVATEEKETRKGLWKYSPGLQPYKARSSLIAGVAAQSDLLPGIRDPNPILDIGRSRSVGGIECAASLSVSLCCVFNLHPLDRDPVFHGYVPLRADTKLSICPWVLLATNVFGSKG